MRHHKFDEVVTLVNANIPVLLTGEKGSGKTTVAMQVAEHLKLPFFSMSMTRQTTLSHLLGFISVNGTYVPSQLRDAADNGGAFLLDELDAGDANVLLCLNTIENGYLSFPDGVVQLHENFRLLATSNPQDQHEHYVGRSKLDAATLDRFDKLDIDHDSELEKSLVDLDVYSHIQAMRDVMKEVNISTVVSMRDTIRYQKRKNLDLLKDYMYRLSGKSDLVYDKYLKAIASMPKHSNQSECKTLDELYALLQTEFSGNNKPDHTESKDRYDRQTY